MENAITLSDQHHAPTAAPIADHASAPLAERSTFELLIRGDMHEVNQRLLGRPLARQLQGLILLSFAGLAIHGAVVSAVAAALQPTGFDVDALLTLPIALPAAFLLALAICLPSFFFYTQLSGLDASFRLVTAQALRSMASASAYLLGALPFYGAYALAYVVGLLEPGPGDAHQVVMIGLCAPYAIGLYGVRVLYRSFQDLLSVVPITHARRGRFLLRMVVAWATVFTAVAPLAVYRIVAFLAEWM